MVPSGRHDHCQRAARDRGVPIYGINYKDKPEDAVAWLERNGDPFARIGADLDGRTAIEWGVYGVPETFIVGPDGTIRHKHVGPLREETLPSFLAALRAAGSGG